MPCMNTYLPLTPPEYYPQYPGCGMQINQHQYAIGSQGLPVPEKGVYEINVDSFGRKLMPSFVRVPQGYHHHHQQQQQQQQPQQQSGYAGLPPPGITHPGTQFYAPVAHQPQRRMDATVPVDENYHLQVRQEARRQEQPAPQEEKLVGGVSAHLDYEMEEMTDFVGTMAQRLVLGPMSHDKLLPSYRKFVHQILSSTRLPSSTILLGLVYLRERMQSPPMSTMPRQDNNVYRLLTIALLLASKFLDDNTFQNKSWSEVTSIPVQELNALEKEWLKDMRWNLHVDPEGTKGFSQYKALWDAWMKKAVAPAPPLAPIETGLRARSHSTFSPAGPVYPFTPPQSGTLSDRIIQLPPVRANQPTEGGYWGWGIGDYSPPSAPHTGPPTPENLHYGWPVSNYGKPQPTPQQGNFSRLPPIVPYHPHGWHHHHHPQGAASCFHCRQQGNENFFNANYGQLIMA
ncbi:hypothetical protein FN846DRAFT_787518 [Sphaerosporella brunnea]|uniref:Cyclin-like protein n=1 Tax=Sphaerosporella brunnea TaxID=1250544 RepID=A0A5J5EFN9_9PEZI|nr:hypothetical protein FN846DRAFT_787518 [Sphaerosporella brunnea]